MNWDQKDLIYDFEVLKGKIDDVLTVHNWFGDDMFNKKELTTKDERMTYAMGYSESRIQHEQTAELMMMYQERFENLIEQFKNLEIKKDRTHDEIGNGQHNVEQ